MESGDFSLPALYSVRIGIDKLLVKRLNDNYSPGPVIREISP